MTDTSTNALFIITSATNAPYPARQPGQANSSQFEALLATVKSISTHAPEARIAVVEYCAYPLTTDQHETLIQHVDYLMDYSRNEQIQGFDRNLPDHQTIAGISELTGLLWFLQVGLHHDLYASFRRVFKMSPGTQLTASPASTTHFSDNAKDRYVFPNAALAADATGVLALRFANDYWSMDASQVPSFIASLQDILAQMHMTVEQGQPVCAEAMLYRHLDAGKIYYDLKPAITQE